MKVLGAYNPRQSLIHTIDTRAKFYILCFCSIAIFFIHNICGLILFALASLCVAKLAQLRLSQCKTALKPLVVLVTVIVLIHMSGISAQGSHQYASFHIGYIDNLIAHCSFRLYLLNISLQGFILGLFYALRLAILVLLSLVFTSTSSHIQISQAIHHMFARFIPQGALYDDIVLVATLALQFIPLTMQEVLNIQRSQQARGACFAHGSMVKRIKAWTPVIIPAIINLFKRSERLAISLEARGYGRCNRTYKPVTAWDRLSKKFFITALVGTIMCVMLNVVNL